MTDVSSDEIDVTVWQHLSGTTWADIGSIDKWSSLSRETRHLQPGPWAKSLPLNAETLKFTAPDAKKYLITTAFRDEETAGVIEHIGPSQADSGGINVDLAGLDAMTLLADALCWPKPGATIDAQDVARYQTSGLAADLLRDVIDANMNRLYKGGTFGIVVPSPTVKGSASKMDQRFGNLLNAVTAKCDANNLGIRVGLQRKGDGSTRADLTAEFYAPRDLSGRVFLSQNVGTLRSWSQSDDAPTATRAVTGGGGTGTQRTFVYPIRTDAESEWGRRREVFLSETDTTDTTELTNRANEELDNAVAQSSFDLETVDAAGMRYGSRPGDAFTLGDSVTIELAALLDGELATLVSKVDRVNAVVLTHDNNGLNIQVRPGNPDVEPLFKQAAIINGLRKTVRSLVTADAPAGGTSSGSAIAFDTDGVPYIA